MKRSFKIFVVSLFVFFAALPVWSQSAKVTFVKGKVEVNRRGSWVAVKAGDTIALSETISTGYQSEARLNLNGSVLAIAALTRVKVETLSQGADTDTVSVYVDTGATRSKVNHTDNKKIDYTTRTAVAVASVRGTVYTQTAAGDTWCDEGFVAVYSIHKDFVVVGKGQTTSIEKDGTPATPQNTQKKAKTKITNTVMTAAQVEEIENSIIDDSSDFTSATISENNTPILNSKVIFNVKVVE